MLALAKQGHNVFNPYNVKDILVWLKLYHSCMGWGTFLRKLFIMSAPTRTTGAGVDCFFFGWFFYLMGDGRGFLDGFNGSAMTMGPLLGDVFFFAGIQSGGRHQGPMGSSFFCSVLGVLPYCWVLEWGPHLFWGYFPHPSAPNFVGLFFLFYPTREPWSGVRASGGPVSLLHRLLLLGRAYMRPSDHPPFRHQC